MSHVTKIECEIRDLKALEAACKQLGLILTKKDTYRWFGRYMQDSPLPQGFAAKDLGKCEYAIGIPDNKNAYEVGVVKRRDGKEGYTLMYDYWSGGYGLIDKIGQGAKTLTREYTLQAATNKFRQKGYNVVRSINTKNKKPMLTVTPRM